MTLRVTSYGSTFTIEPGTAIVRRIPPCNRQHPGTAEPCSLSAGHDSPCSWAQSRKTDESVRQVAEALARAST